MATERHYFRSTVEQTGHRLAFARAVSSNRITMILFTHYKLTKNCWFEAPTRMVNGPKKILAKAVSFVRLCDMLSERRRYTAVMAEKLTSIHVPEDEQAAIIEKLFQLVEVAFPGIAIIVHVWNVTVYFLDSASSLGPGDLARSLWATTPFDEHDQMTVDRYAMESMETYEARTKIIPATNSCIDGLERVRFDSLETNIRHMPCAICKERLDYFAVEEGTDQQLMITRLPCSHLYHGDCIAQWLESNHLCPLCRYPLPTVEEAGESSQPLHWNMLVMSAGGILTTAACFALQMIEAKFKTKISDHLLYFVPLVAMYSSKFL